MVTIAAASVRILIPKVIQNAAQGDISETANTIPTRTSITPAPASPISLNILFIRTRISHSRGNVNHNFDALSKNYYPLAKRLEGIADGTLVQRGNRGIN